jgi:hypothetical protein
MGWALLPHSFFAASETARDITSLYLAETIGALPQHMLEGKTMTPVDNMAFTLPDTGQMDGNQQAG